MPPPIVRKPDETESIDFRQYLGIVVFRWKIIAVCFLWCLLGGVVYLQMAEKQYSTFARIVLHKDGMKDLPSPRGPMGWDHHLRTVDGWARDQAERKLRDAWPHVPAHKRKPAVNLSWIYGWQGAIDFKIQSSTPAYAAAFLAEVVENHKREWERWRRSTVVSATSIMDGELALLLDHIRRAEDDVIEYQRVNRIPVIKARAALEQAWLGGIIGRISQLQTEQFMVEMMHPLVKDLNAGVLHHVNLLTRESGATRPVGLTADALSRLDELARRAGDLPATVRREPLLQQPEGLHDKKVRLYLLHQREEDLASKFTGSHPELQQVRSEIAEIDRQLDVIARVQLESLLDRNQAINIQLKALQEAEYQWEAKYYQTAKLESEFGRVKSLVDRYERSYNTIFSRVHDLRLADEMNAERYIIQAKAHSSTTPSWPVPFKILVVALALGVGSGFGLAFVIQVLDNKVQSIKDVEKELGLPFLGGIPYWVHSNLEKSIRPIVTEEFSAGAVEAYRALRTSVVAAADRAGEKIILVTSADSKEGKTLTCLNLSIMLAQTGKRVLLVDMDLRRGRLHRSLGVERSPGVTDALHEGLSLRDVVVQTRYPNLDFAPSGGNKEHVAEDLHACSLPRFFGGVGDAYDYILIDTAPVLRVTDTTIIATQDFGVVVYVAHVNRTPKPLIRYSLNLLAHAKVIGLIMNSIEMHKISGLYYSYQYPNYAYYSNAYNYGYSYGYYHDGDESGRPRGPRRARGVRGLLARFGRYMTPTQ